MLFKHFLLLAIRSSVAYRLCHARPSPPPAVPEPASEHDPVPDATRPSAPSPSS